MATKQSDGGETWTAEEKAAMRERARELKAAGKKADFEADLLAKIAEMDEQDRVMAERIHALVKEHAPSLSPKTWYGMPAYVNAEGKTVNSALYGEPALEPWLRARGSSELVVVGIQTNMCVETTARMGGNLGFAVTVPLDATRTFDLEGPAGASLTADQLALATAVNLQGGGFAKVITTAEVLADL